MNENIANLKNEIKEIEDEMNSVDFWNNKDLAQEKIKRLKELKDELNGENTIDNGNAILNILAGAGGDDSEDWARMLLEMYIKFFEKNKCEVILLHENKNEHNGYRNISLEINGKIKLKKENNNNNNESNLEEEKIGIYKALKNESGVHRLVRISPFNANQKRHTSFAMIEVLPVLPKLEFEKFKKEMKDDDFIIETSKSSGPGGQNVNKRETAVRIIHKLTNISVHVSNERSQEKNKEKAFQMIYAKLFKIKQEEEKNNFDNKKISKITEIEWGNQIRNYVLHPYKLIKDLRTNIETNDIENILMRGNLDEFINAEKDL